MALKSKFRFVLTAAERGFSKSSCRPRRGLSSLSFESFLSPERGSAAAPQGAGNAGSRSKEARGLGFSFREHSDVAFRLSNSRCLIPASGSADGYRCGVLGARVRFRKFEISIRSHSRYFATRNWAEDEGDDDDEGSDDERGKSGDHARLRDRDVKWHVDKLCPTSLRVRQIKEVDFDDIIEMEKKLKIVLKVKDLLLADPKNFMTLQDLGKCRDYIGFKGNNRIIAFLRKYPGVFDVHENPELGRLPWFQLSPEAEALCEEELEIRRGMKIEAVTKLRKLLMMSNDKRLLLVKIAHIRKDIGLPEDFRKRLVFRYPKYFRVIEREDVTNEDGRILELVKWSDRLAVTAEEQRVQDIMEKNKLDSPPRLELQLPKRYRLSNKDKYVLYKFHELDCPSPYGASSHLDPASPEAEKRAMLLIKELLSLTLEKRIYVDHLTHFRKEFKLSNQVRGVLIRHPEHFYVSRKGARDTVFLREAYEGIHVPGQRQRHVLKEKHLLVKLKEKYFSLMEVKRVFATQQSTDPVPLQESTLEEEGELSPQESASIMSVSRAASTVS